MLSILQEDIEKVALTKTFSRYYLFEALPYIIYFDKYTGSIYFNVTAISFSEIKEANFDDPELFRYGYIVN